ncbi:MAG TPA: hypothetical protein VMS65_14520 [Polyangiaceae bacterium]|nr:hypothetical protein [Polyangiaceae bacterium]
MSNPGAGARNPDAREHLGVLLAFLRRAARFWFVPLLAIVAGGIAAGVVLYLRQPTYRSETVVLYSYGSGSGDATASSTELRSITTRLRELLMSRVNLERVVTEFDLYPEARSAHGIIEGVDELKEHIAFRAPGGDTFGVAFEGTSPTQARLVTTRLAELVMADDSGLRKKQAGVLRDFLVAEKEKTETRLRDTERELAAFMAKHPRFALDATSFAAGAAIRASIDPSVSGRAGARVPPPGLSSGSLDPRGASRGRDIPPEGTRALPSDPNSEVARANAALSAARANLAERLEHYTPAHPDVRAAVAAVERGERRLALSSAEPTSEPPAAVPLVASDTPSRKPIRIASQPPRGVAPVASGGESVKPGERDVVVLETQWSRLTRGVTEARQRQDHVEAQLFKADIVASSESGGQGLQMTVIDPAFLPVRATPPGQMTIASIFVALALALGLFGAVLCATVDDRIYGARDLAAFSVVLVEIPRLSKYPGAHVLASQDATR